MHILMTGGTGFIGTALKEEFLKSLDNQITILSRAKLADQERVNYITDLAQLDLQTKFEVIINLAGASVSYRWTKKYKKELIESRVRTTNQLVSFIKSLKYKPDLFISASAIGYYGTGNAEYIDEQTIFDRKSQERIKSDFMHCLCQQWEEEAMHAKDSVTRLYIMRLGVVLGHHGGALQKMLPIFKLGLGGKIGTGRQFFSWIHINDVVRIVQKSITDQNIRGVLNIVAPQPVRNIIFTNILAKILRKPAYLAAPSILIKLIFGEMGQKLLLNGSAIYPANLIKIGYKFQFTEIKSALNDLVQKS